jgi:hypothetical protein
MRVKFSFSCGRLSLLDYEPTYAPDGEVRPRFWSLPLEANDEGGAAFGGMHEQDVVGGICMTPTDRRLAPDTMQAIRCRRLGGGKGKWVVCLGRFADTKLMPAIINDARCAQAGLEPSLVLWARSRGIPQCPPPAFSTRRYRHKAGREVAGAGRRSHVAGRR